MDNNWSLKYNKLVYGNDDVSFVQDQSGSTPEGSVLQVEYPAGSYNRGTGGAQFYVGVWASGGRGRIYLLTERDTLAPPGPAPRPV